MKLALFLILSFLFTQGSFGQDRLVLISGDTLSGEMISMSAQLALINEGETEREVPSGLISQVILKTGKHAVFQPIPPGLDFGKNFKVLEYSPKLARHIDLLFPTAVKRSYSLSNGSSLSILPAAPYLKATEGTGEHRDVDLSTFTTFGYACNAFLAVVESRPGMMTFTFFSNTVKAARIREEILHRSYSLKDFRTVGSTAGLADYKFTPFTMKFTDSLWCEFIQDGKLTMLKYTISQDGSILFRDAKKRRQGTKYEVVFIDGQTMRYTYFTGVMSANLVTRKVETIDEKEVIAK